MAMPVYAEESTPVYVYAKQSEYINGTLNSSGWYTIGKVMVDGLDAPHANPTEEELELILSSLENIEYISTAPVYIEDLGNWKLILEPKGANDYVKNGNTWHLNSEYVHNHNFILTEPTCLEDGTLICECGETKVVAALGHEMGEWVVVKEPTYEEVGRKERYCIREDYTEFEEIPMLIKEKPPVHPATGDPVPNTGDTENLIFWGIATLASLYGVIKIWTRNLLSRK